MKKWLLVFMHLGGCARTKTVPVVITNPLQVKVEYGSRTKPTSCYLESMPEAPKEIESTLAEEDVVRRVFVHIRQYNEMVQFAHDMTMWGASVTSCIDDLTEDMQ